MVAAASFTFFLGTHQPEWLSQASVPLFVSRRRLRRLDGRRGEWPRARGVWALDSGGFSELTLYGKWRTTPEFYAHEVRRCRDEIGQLRWAAIQDYMCEDVVLAKTGMSLLEHQGLTVTSYRKLLQLAPDLPWAPVLQGLVLSDYQRCADLYERRGFDLNLAPAVGVGSICRRQGTDEAREILTVLAERFPGKLHAFGLKKLGLELLRDKDVPLQSADSMAWSLRARKAGPQPECLSRHPGSCNNCLHFALKWRGELMRKLAA